MTLLSYDDLPGCLTTVLRIDRFLFGLLRNLPLSDCAAIGCLTGAAAVRVMGAELSLEGSAWLMGRLPRSVVSLSALDLPSDVHAHEIHNEILAAEALIRKFGVGSVFFGSARLGPASPFW